MFAVLLFLCTGTIALSHIHGVQSGSPSIFDQIHAVEEHECPTCSFQLHVGSMLYSPVVHLPLGLIETQNAWSFSRNLLADKTVLVLRSRAPPFAHM